VSILDTDRSTNSILLSIYSDSSISFRYLQVLDSYSLGDYAGLWGAVATEQSSSLHELRYHEEAWSSNAGDLMSGLHVTYCNKNLTACLAQSCVQPSTDLVINYNSTSTCLALSSNLLHYQCIWYGGVNHSDASITQATSASLQTGQLSCPVPMMKLSDGSIVSVDLVTFYTTPDQGEISSASLDNIQGSKAIYGVYRSPNQEVARSNMLVRYYQSDRPENCGCSVLYPGQSCDYQGVCGGVSSVGDCMDTPYGSAYRDACGDCTAGYTGSIPTFDCSAQNSGELLNIVFQIVMLFVIISFLTIMTNVVSYFIRRSLVHRAQQEAFLVESELAIQVLQAGVALPRNRHGLSEFELEALGTINFTKSFWMQHLKDRGEDGGEICDCSICLMEISESNVARILPEPCGHIFHVGCIDEWFKRSSICPLCKRSMRTILEGDEENALVRRDASGHSGRMMFIDDDDYDTGGSYRAVPPLSEERTFRLMESASTALFSFSAVPPGPSYAMNSNNLIAESSLVSVQMVGRPSNGHLSSSQMLMETNNQRHYSI
jgi:hypothetical protein